MPTRFFVDAPITGDQARLSKQESHHLLHVLRGKIDDRVVVFDGTGGEFDAVVVDVERGRVKLGIVARRQSDHELPFPLTLGVALPKGDRQRQLVEHAVELGVTRLTPLCVTRGVAQPTEKALVRLRRTVIQSSKQCGRTRLMEVTQPLPLTEYLAQAPHDALLVFAHPGGEPAQTMMKTRSVAQEIFTAIGPEGGFTCDEAELAADHHWRILDLGPRVLRVETAAGFLTALLILSSPS